MPSPTAQWNMLSTNDAQSESLRSGSSSPSSSWLNRNGSVIADSAFSTQPSDVGYVDGRSEPPQVIRQHITPPNLSGLPTTPVSTSSLAPPEPTRITCQRVSPCAPVVNPSLAPSRLVLQHTTPLNPSGPSPAPVHTTSDRKSTRLNSSHSGESRMPSSA